MIQKTVTQHNGKALTVDQAAEGWKEFDDRTKSSEAGYNSIGELALKVKNLDENQVTGHEVYTTFADLPAVGVDKVSYKVSSDPDSTKNGFWHWDTGTTSYIKDDDSEVQNNLNEEVAKNVLREQIVIEGSDAFAFAKRVKDEGGTTIDIIPLDEIIRDNLRKVSVMITPHGVSEGMIHSILPVSGNSDTGYSRTGLLSFKNRFGIQKIASENNAAIDFDDNGRFGILMPPASENLLISPQNFNDISWTKGGSTTVTDNYSLSPDGLQNATRIQMPVGSGTYISASFSAVIGKTYTMTVMVKNNNGGVFVLGFGTAASVLTNLANSGTIIPSDEWTEYSFSYTATSTTTLHCGIDNVFNSSLIDLQIFSSQVEEGSLSTPFIPKVDGSAVRGLSMISPSNLPTNFNANEGSFYYEAYLDKTGVFRTPLGLTDTNSTTNGVWSYMRSDNKIQLQVRVNGSDIFFVVSQPLNTGQFYKVAARWKSGDSKLFVLGGVAGSSANNFEFDSRDQLKELRSHLGASINPYTGILRERKVFANALTDEELMKMTGFVSFDEMAIFLDYLMH